MGLSVKHKFTSPKGNSTDPTLVQPSNWNDDHAYTMDTARLIGRTTAGTGAFEQIGVGSGLTLTGGVLNTAAGYAAVNKAGDTMSGALSITSGGLNLTTGGINISNGNINVVGDIYAYRAAAPTTGVIWFGNAGNRYLFYDGTAYNLNAAGLNVGGNVTAPDFVSTSDERVKDNIAPLEGALNAVKQLVGVGFTRRDTGEASIGFIAQAVEQVEPRLVTQPAPTDDNPDPMRSISYGTVTALLVEAVKEIEASFTRISDELKAELAALRAKTGS